MAQNIGGVTVSYNSPSGESWLLITPEPGVSRQLSVFLADSDLEGLAGVPERSDSSLVTGYGARPRGWSLPALESSFEYWARSETGELETVLRSWRDAWDFEQPGDYYDAGHQVTFGELWVSSPVGGAFWAEVSDPVFPSFPAGVNRAREVRESMSFRIRSGHWWGESEFFTGEVVVRPEGDRPLSPRCRLLWDGSATSVTFPSGLTVSLPEIGVERIINLDRGMSGQVLRPDGTVDTGGWSALQGVVHGVSLRPKVESRWVLGDGVTLEVTPRFLSPWR